MSFIWDGVSEAFQLLTHPDDALGHIFWVTLRVAFESTAIAAVIGLPIGLALGLGRFRGRHGGLVVANAGLALPPVLVGLVASLFLFRQAPLGGLHLIYTVDGVIYAQALLALPIVVALTAAAVQAVSPDLLQQAESLGARRSQQWLLALSEARVAVMAALIASIGSALSEVGLVVLVGGNVEGQTQTLASAILDQVAQGAYDRGIAYGILLLGLILIVTGVLTVIQQGSTRREARGWT